MYFGLLEALRESADKHTAKMLKVAGDCGIDSNEGGRKGERLLEIYIRIG